MFKFLLILFSVPLCILALNQAVDFQKCEGEWKVLYANPNDLRFKSCALINIKKPSNMNATSATFSMSYNNFPWEIPYLLPISGKVDCKTKCPPSEICIFDTDCENYLVLSSCLNIFFFKDFVVAGRDWVLSDSNLTHISQVLSDRNFKFDQEKQKNNVDNC